MALTYTPFNLNKMFYEYVHDVDVTTRTFISGTIFIQKLIWIFFAQPVMVMYRYLFVCGGWLCVGVDACVCFLHTSTLPGVE